MAEVKLVNVTQLDADLTSIADAIRAKTGSSGTLVFPAEFVSSIGSISGGGSGEGVSNIDYYCFPSSWIYPERFSSHWGSEIYKITASNLDDSFSVGCGEDNDWYIYAYSEGLTTITMELNSGDIETYVFCCIDTDRLTLNDDYTKTRFTIKTASTEYEYSTLPWLKWSEWIGSYYGSDNDFSIDDENNVYFEKSNTLLYTTSGLVVSANDYMSHSEYTDSAYSTDEIAETFDVSVLIHGSYSLSLGIYDDDYTNSETINILSIGDSSIASAYSGHADEVVIDGYSLGNTTIYAENGLGMIFRINITVTCTDTYDITIKKGETITMRLPDPVTGISSMGTSGDINIEYDHDNYINITCTGGSGSDSAYIKTDDDRVFLFNFTLIDVYNVELSIGCTENISLDVDPWDEDVTSISTVYSEDGIATVQMDGYSSNSLNVTATEIGTTIVTVTANNGFIYEIRITVKLCEYTFGSVNGPITIKYRYPMTWAEWMESEYNTAGFAPIVNNKGVTIAVAIRIDDVIYGVADWYDLGSPISSTRRIGLPTDDLQYSLEPFSNYPPNCSVGYDWWDRSLYVGETCDITIETDGFGGDIVEVNYEDPNQDLVDVTFEGTTLTVTSLKKGTAILYVTNSNNGVAKISIYSRYMYNSTYDITLKVGEQTTSYPAYNDILTSSITYTNEGIATLEPGTGMDVDITGIKNGKTTATLVVTMLDYEYSACFTYNISVYDEITEIVTLPASETETSVTLFEDKNYSSITVNGIDVLTDAITSVVSNDNGTLTINYKSETDLTITVYCTVI